MWWEHQGPAHPFQAILGAIHSLPARQANQQRPGSHTLTPSIIRPGLLPPCLRRPTFPSRLRPLSCCTLTPGLAGGRVTNAVIELEADGAMGGGCNPTGLAGQNGPADKVAASCVASIIVTKADLLHRHHSSSTASTSLSFGLSQRR